MEQKEKNNLQSFISWEWREDWFNNEGIRRKESHFLKSSRFIELIVASVLAIILLLINIL